MQHLALGVYDNPLKQTQNLLEIDLLKNNIVIFGGAMTGKTTFLKTLLVRMHQEVSSNEEIYILDFGNNLGLYNELHNVCACFNSSNEENIKRIFKIVEEKLNNNSKKLNNQNYITYYNNKNNSVDIPHITFIIDNANAFFTEEGYSIYQETLLKFCRDGLSKGLTIILTASNINIPNRILSNFGKKISFEVSNDDYISIFGKRVTQPMKFKGRGLVNMDTSVFEFQCFLPFVDEEKELTDFINFTNKNGINPKKLKSFDDDLTFKNWQKYVATDVKLKHHELVVGLDYYKHLPVCVNFNENRVIAIYGKKHFGKTNLLNVLLQQLIIQHQNYSFVLFDDGRKQLQELKNLLENKKISVEYFVKLDDFKNYINNNHISIQINRTTRVETNIEVKNNVVFILQNRMLFQSNNKNFMNIAYPQMVAQAVDFNYIFIYTDVGKISDLEMSTNFNDTISVAFLLDNISDFVNNKGQKSVFGNMDINELKNEYAPCELGDGYYYDIDSDELKKLKFIKLDL